MRAGRAREMVPLLGGNGVSMAAETAERARRGRRVLPLAIVFTAAAAAVAAGLFADRASKHSAPVPEATAVSRALPQAPIAGRLGEAAVWTGRELIVAGGLNRRSDGTFRAVGDGAAYDPAAGRWRKIAPPPAGVGAGAVWTGRELVTWTGNMPVGPAVGAVYDPRTNIWRRLPTGPLGPREGNANVWAGEELLVIGGYSGDALATPVAAAVDPATGSWRVLHGLDRLALFGGPNGAVWDGREAVIAGTLSLCPQKGSACARSRPIVVAYNPATDRIRELRLPSAPLGAETAGSLTPLAWTGSEVIFRASAAGSLRVLTYAPATGRWQTGSRAPCALPHGSDTQTVWAGNRLVVPCGAGALQIYDPAARSWERLTLVPGATPLDSAAGSAAAWTGTRIVVWSGWTFRRFNPTPADGDTLTLPE